ncbi:ADP-ribosylation, partial [Bimuria novae-zelandiae CBS 107.79]
MDDALDTRSLEERFTVTYVFRADKRSPAEIDAAGGFLPKGWTSKSKFEDISLYRHGTLLKGAANGFSMDNDGYVSTTSSQSVAEGWVVKFLGGSGYTYKIATYANLIDVQDTLKKYNIYPEEKEFAALKIIPFDQIMGWASFSKTPKYGVVKGTPVANKKFNRAKYENKAHGGAQYSLAGFPNNHPAWKEDPWWFFTHC